MQCLSMARALTIRADGQNRVTYVGYGQPPDGCTATDTLINGVVAETMYLALTGHTYEESPGEANIRRAIAARLEIMSRNQPADWAPRLVLLAWGSKIQPWLGLTKLIEARPVCEDPAYAEVVEYSLRKYLPMSLKL